MQPMKFSAYIGRRRIATRRGHMRALRAILENANSLVEVGVARIEREDGVVVARIDLDFPVPDGRDPQWVKPEVRKLAQSPPDTFEPENEG